MRTIDHLSGRSLASKVIYIVDAADQVAFMRFIPEVEVAAHQTTMMSVMGWSIPAMTQRYAHVVNQVRDDVARRVGTLLWPGTEGDSSRPALSGRGSSAGSAVQAD